MSSASGLDTAYRGGFVRGVHHFALRVYFDDTDAAGIVYYANYLRFMERARTEMLRDAGIHQRAVMEAGEGFYVVAEAAIRYRTPARLDDELIVLSRLEAIRPASVVIHQRVMRRQELVAEATITAAFVASDGRPKRQPRAWVETFERLKGEASE